MSTPFRSYRFTWWQLALLKITLLLIGIPLGAALGPVVLPSLWWWLIAAIPPARYLRWLSFKPDSPTKATKD